MEWMLMPLKRYAEFSGRSRRMEYWMWIVFQFLIGLVFMVLMFAMGGAALMSGDPTQAVAAVGAIFIVYILYGLVGLIFLVPSLAVTVRRLHDTNRSGWWILAPWGPYILAFIFMSMAAAGGGKPDSTGFAAMGILAMVAILAAVVMGLVLLVFMFLEGTRGPNQYGPDPKGGVSAQVFT